MASLGFEGILLPWSAKFFCKGPLNSAFTREKSTVCDLVGVFVFQYNFIYKARRGPIGLGVQLTNTEPLSVTKSFTDMSCCFGLTLQAHRAA